MKRRAVRASLVALALVLIISTAASASPGARAIGMGGAYVAVANDATAAFLNPAALTTLVGPEMIFDYGLGYLPNRVLVAPQVLPSDAWPQRDLSGNPVACDTQAAFPYLAFASPTSESGLAYGLSVYRTSLHSFEPFNFFLPFPASYPATIGQDTAIGYSLAGEILPGLSIGGTVKLGLYTTERPWIGLDDEENPYLVTCQHQFLHVNLDAGLLYRPIPQLALGLVCYDLNQTKLEYQIPEGLNPAPAQLFSQTIRFPYQLRWGAAFMLPPFLTVAVDMTSLPQSYLEILSSIEAGAELRLNRLFAVRAGSNRGVLTLGAGLGVPFEGAGSLRVDYAFVSTPYGSHFLSASWLF